MSIPRRALLASSLVGLAIGTSGCATTSVRVVSGDEAARALEAARARLGDPYQRAGQAPGGFDCSGLIIWAYEQAVGLLRLQRPDGQVVTDATMNEIYSFHCLRLRTDQVRPGDIIAIAEDGGEVATHGGLVECVDGNEVRFVNASSYYEQVVSDVWPLVGSKRGQYVLGFGRLLVAERLLFGLVRF